MAIWPVQPVFNANSLPLDQNPGTLPNMADTIMNWFQLLTFEQVTKTVVNFQVQETKTVLRFQGVMVRFTGQQLRMKPEGQRLWKWWKIYALPVTSLSPDDVIVDQRGIQYRVMNKVDNSQFGYVEYDIQEDFSGSGPT